MLIILFIFIFGLFVSVLVSLIVLVLLLLLLLLLLLIILLLLLLLLLLTTAPHGKGVRLAEFPLEPMHARMLLASAEMGCSQEIVTITAMLQARIYCIGLLNLQVYPLSF